jgi:neutral amino acid transport system permease protein
MVTTGLLNAVFQGLVTSAIIAAGALGLTLIYSIAEVPNFAHGDMITIGAYLALALNSPDSVPFLPDFGGFTLVLAAIGAIVLAGVLAASYELTIFRQFRHRNADLITMVIVSLGLAYILRNIVLFIVGSKNVNYETPFVRAVNYDFAISAGGLALRTSQRRAGEIVTLDSWQYPWIRVVAALAVALVVAVGIYRWQRKDADFDAVYLVSPRILAISSFLVVVGLGAFLLRVGTDPVQNPFFETRIGVSTKQVTILGVVLAGMFLLNLLLKKTRLGTAMRATADNMSLAEIKGIDVNRVQLVVWIVAGVFTATAGILTGWFASNLHPNMGFNLLLPMFAAVILGGLRSPYGAVMASIVVGVAMDVGVYFLPPDFSTYRTAIAFLILIGVLLVKPEGLWGDV